MTKECFRLWRARQAGGMLCLLLLLLLSAVVCTGTGARASTVVSSATIGGCPLFPARNIWNTDISHLPVASRSASYIASIGLTGHLHPDFGSGVYNGEPIGIPYVVVPGSQPGVSVSFQYADESDPGPYPIPASAPVEGGLQSTGDRHVLVVDRGNCTLYEMYASYPQKNGSWRAGSGAVWHLTSNALRPATWTSADAAGLPILPGLVTYDEVASGVITHALRVTVSQTQRAFLWPARHFASSQRSSSLPPMGLRLRLKASVNISSFPRVDQIILTALKRYGMFVADNGSSWFLSGSPDNRWNNDTLHALTSIPGADFEAVDESHLQVSASSGEAAGLPLSSSTPTRVPATPRASIGQTEFRNVLAPAGGEPDKGRRGTAGMLWPVFSALALICCLGATVFILNWRKKARVPRA
jgi:hypothetical protein